MTPAASDGARARASSPTLSNVTVPTLAIVLCGHFLSAFAVLGMPVFLPLMLARIDPRAPAWLNGVLYVLPPLMTALSGPLWGRLADRFGRLLSLRRAYLGLACGFLLAGFSHHVASLAVALVIQGLCGGAMAASNAYLAGQTDRDGLRRALNWTQFSARLAMVAAPVAIGVAISTTPAAAHAAPLSLYRWLALLPLTALILSFALPADGIAADRSQAPARAPAAGDTPQVASVMRLQALLCAAMVVTFPYFVPFVAALGTRDTTIAGIYAALPHLAYLLGLPLLRGHMPKAALSRGFGLIGLACLGQAWLTPTWLPLLPVLRLTMGVGLLLAYQGLHHALSGLASGGASGRLFGRFDAVGKWAGAGAGLAAGLAAQSCGVTAPFWLAAALAAAALVVSRASRAVRQDCGDR